MEEKSKAESQRLLQKKQNEEEAAARKQKQAQQAHETKQHRMDMMRKQQLHELPTIADQHKKIEERIKQQVKLIANQKQPSGYIQQATRTQIYKQDVEMTDHQD